MNHNTIWVIEVIAICSVCTLFERALPFLLFQGKEVPKAINDLGKMLPLAIMTTLVFYCVRNVEFTAAAGWAPQLISCAVTSILHIWRGNTLLSIAGGTICCMVLTQFVF